MFLLHECLFHFINMIIVTLTLHDDVLLTAIVSDGKVAAVGALRSQAKEKLVPA